MKGNEQDCICEKPEGKHRKNCDAYRLAQFRIKMASVIDRGGKVDFIKQI